MKKLILSAALLCGFAWNANAQTSDAGTTDGGIKPTAGDVTLEANVNLFEGNVNLSNSLQQVRGRYFLSDKMALRLGVDLSYESTAPETDVKASTLEFSIAPGIEKHFAGTNRLSPYIGAELLFGLKTANYEDERETGGIERREIKGAWEGGANRGHFLVGIGAVAGFDFYVARHLYVGYELGFEISSRTLSEIETTVEPEFGPEITTTSDSQGTLTIGPNIRNGIRVGFVF